MSLPSPTDSTYDWEADVEFTTVPPPASIERVRVDEILDEPHRTLFCRAIRNVLQSKPARFTFAQLVDGLPLEKVARSTFGVKFHQAVTEHETLCPGAMDKARAFLDNFDPCGLDLPVNVLKRYQNIPTGSRASRLPFIELVAVAIHRIAVLVYKQGSMHKETGLPTDEDRLCHDGGSGENITYYPTPFCLDEYADPAQYPDGVADIAGYWAENWIFGGVVVFSRGESGNECRGVWLHSFRRYTTRQVWALNVDQLRGLLTFLNHAEDNPADCPLPIVLGRANPRRVDPDNCIPEENVYRDRWERKMKFPSHDVWVFTLSCVDIEHAYPLSEDEWDLF